MDGPATRRFLAAALAILAVALSACGDDESSDAGGPLSADEWSERVQGFCSDGYQEATALPLPESVQQLEADAASRAEILANVRDSILTLGQPDGISSDDVGGYVDELNADIDQLAQISDAAKSGAVDPSVAQLDESAGQAAGELGLDDCVALAEAVARTP